GWRLARTPAGACASPDALAASNAQWLDARVPGTVASSIHREPAARGDYDADDWWYRLELKLPAIDPARRYRLRFDGLATLAGRIPGWTPPIQPVGPWAPIALEIIDGLDITSFALHATAKGSDGRLVVDMRAVPPAGAQIDEARVRVGDRVFALAVQSANI